MYGLLKYLNLTKPNRNSSKLTGRHGSLQDDLGAHFGFERASNTRHNTVFVIRLKTFSFLFLMRKFFLDSKFKRSGFKFYIFIFFCTLLFHKKIKLFTKPGTSDRCKIPSDGVPISSNQPVFGISGQTKLMQI